MIVPPRPRRRSRRHRQRPGQEPVLADRLGEHVVAVAAPRRWPGGAERLARLLHMRTSAAAQDPAVHGRVKRPCWAGSPYQPIPVAEHVSEQVAVQVLEDQRQFPGVTAEVQPVISTAARRRRGPGAGLPAAHHPERGEEAASCPPGTGFSGVDLVGQSGLEEEYDQPLRGRPAPTRSRSTRPARSPARSGGTAAQAGDNLVTSINAKIQVDTQNALARRSSRPGGRERGQPGRPW